MIQWTVRLEDEQFKAMLKKNLEGVYQAWFGQAQIEAERLVKMLRDAAPKKSGRFAQGIHLAEIRQTTRGVLRMGIAFPDPPFRHIVNDTAPHNIPKNHRPPGKPLHFVWGSRGDVFYYNVRHPGTKANPFVQRTIMDWIPQANSRLKLRVMA